MMYSSDIIADLMEQAKKVIATLDRISVKLADQGLNNQRTSPLLSPQKADGKIAKPTVSRLPLDSCCNNDAKESQFTSLLSENETTLGAHHVFDINPDPNSGLNEVLGVENDLDNTQTSGICRKNEVNEDFGYMTMRNLGDEVGSLNTRNVLDEIPLPDFIREMAENVRFEEKTMVSRAYNLFTEMSEPILNSNQHDMNKQGYETNDIQATVDVVDIHEDPKIPNTIRYAFDSLQANVDVVFEDKMECDSTLDIGVVNTHQMLDAMSLTDFFSELLRVTKFEERNSIGCDIDSALSIIPFEMLSATDSLMLGEVLEANVIELLGLDLSGFAPIESHVLRDLCTEMGYEIVFTKSGNGWIFQLSNRNIDKLENLYVELSGIGKLADTIELNLVPIKLGNKACVEFVRILITCVHCDRTIHAYFPIAKGHMCDIRLRGGYKYFDPGIKLLKLGLCYIPTLEDKGVFRGKEDKLYEKYSRERFIGVVLWCTEYHKGMKPMEAQIHVFYRGRHNLNAHDILLYTMTVLSVFIVGEFKSFCSNGKWELMPFKYKEVYSRNYPLCYGDTMSTITLGTSPFGKNVKLEMILLVSKGWYMLVFHSYCGLVYMTNVNEIQAGLIQVIVDLGTILLFTSLGPRILAIDTSSLFLTSIFEGSKCALISIKLVQGRLLEGLIAGYRKHGAFLTHLGGVRDGRTSNTKAFRSAIENLSKYAADGGAELIVPSRKWLTDSFNLTSHFTLYHHQGVVLLAFQDEAVWHVFPPFPSYGKEMDDTNARFSSLTDVVVQGFFITQAICVSLLTLLQWLHNDEHQPFMVWVFDPGGYDSEPTMTKRPQVFPYGAKRRKFRRREDYQSYVFDPGWSLVLQDHKSVRLWSMEGVMSFILEDKDNFKGSVLIHTKNIRMGNLVISSYCSPN